MVYYGAVNVDCYLKVVLFRSKPDLETEVQNCGCSLPYNWGPKLFVSGDTTTISQRKRKCANVGIDKPKNSF